MEGMMTDTDQFAAKTICLVLTRRRFGNSKKASMAEVTTEADKTLLNLSKQLLDSPELEAIGSFDGKDSTYLKNVAFKSLFKGGVYLVPVAMVESLTQRLETRKVERADLVEYAVQAYHKRIDETAERLGPQYAAEDYPSDERFRQSFGFEYSWVTFDTPTRLKAISASIFETEREKARQKLTAAAEDCKMAMRSALGKLVSHLVERLTPAEDGKTKRLSTSTIGHLNEFLSMFELRNVTDDAELGVVVEQARAAMNGVDHDVLKSDELIAKKVAADLEKVHAALEPLITAGDVREISFEEE